MKKRLLFSIIPMILILGCVLTASIFANAADEKAVYLADNGTSDGGLTPEAPINSLNDAIKKLGGNGTIVVCGKYSITEKMLLDAHSYGITVTSVFGGVDYQKTGAGIEMAGSLLLGGETRFENIKITNTKGSIFIQANANKLTMGDGINTVPYINQDNGGSIYIGIIGGREDNQQNVSIDLTINSGSWGIVRAGASSKSLYENNMKINLTVNGGYFRDYVTLSSRGNINGGVITFTANGGVFYGGIYGVFEENLDSYKANYDITFNLNGGEFHQRISPACWYNTKISGSYTVNLNGGDYKHLTDLEGTEKFSGSMTSALNIADGVDISAAVTGDVTYQNALRHNGPDPWVFYHDGNYYYTHTTGKNIVIMKVANFADISTAEETVIVRPTEGVNMWSPEIHYFSEEEVGKENEGWYLYIGYDDGTTANQRQYVLKCLDGDNFLGKWGDPVTGKVNQPRKVEFPDAPTYNVNEFCAGTSKIVINGKSYMTFVSEVGRETRNFYQTINITEFSNPWTFTGKPVVIVKPTYQWEMGGHVTNSEGKTWPKVVEGASALYGDNGEVYLMYTGSGYWTTKYQLGYMTFLGGDPLDANNWKKNPRSILSLSNQVNGCGHGSYFKDHNGDYYVAYHGYLGTTADGGRYIHIERIYPTATGVSIGNGTGHPAPLSTVYNVKANPRSLAEKISGFPQEGGTQPPASTDTDTSQLPAEPQDKGGVSTTVAIIIIVAIVVVAGGVCAFVLIKPSKKAQTSDGKTDDSQEK